MVSVEELGVSAEDPMMVDVEEHLVEEVVLFSNIYELILKKAKNKICKKLVLTLICGLLFLYTSLFRTIIVFEGKKT